jgi:hypothetical protein
LLGKDAPGLSSTAIARLKDGSIDEDDAWQKRDLSAKRKDPRLLCQGSAIALGTAGSVKEIALDAEYRAEGILVIDVVEAAPSA